MDTPIRQQLYAALALYNNGDYESCQERLEALYAEAGEADQPLVRGLLALSCGMYVHFHRGGGRGALNLLRQSLVALDDFRPRYLGIEIEDLIDAVQAYLADLEERRRPGAGFFDRWLAPRIRFRDQP